MKAYGRVKVQLHSSTLGFMDVRVQSQDPAAISSEKELPFFTE